MLDTVRVSPWQKPWAPEFGEQSASFNPVTGRHYVGLNRLDLALAGGLSGYVDPRWMGLPAGGPTRLAGAIGRTRGLRHLPVEIHQEKGRGRDGLDRERSPEQSETPQAAALKGRAGVQCRPDRRYAPIDPTPLSESSPKSPELDVIARQMGMAIAVRARERAAFADQYGYDGTKARELAQASGHPNRL